MSYIKDGQSSTLTGCQNANTFHHREHYIITITLHFLDSLVKSRSRWRSVSIKWGSLNLPDLWHKTDSPWRPAACRRQHCSRPRPRHCSPSGRGFWGQLCSPPYRTPPAGCWGRRGWATEETKRENWNLCILNPCSNSCLVFKHSKKV